MLKLSTLLLSLVVFAPPAAANWYLNTKGVSGPYQIFRYGDDGLPVSVSPVASPPAGTQHLAWPSAVDDGNEWRLYASIYASGQWGDVGLWISANEGASWAYGGVIFSPDPQTEPYGIGPAHVVYDPNAAEPYVVYYVVRGAAGPGPEIRVATSADGKTEWRRHGTIVAAGGPYETGGLAMTFVCRASDGDWVLAYHGYFEGSEKAAALIAIAPDRIGPFTKHGKIMEGDDFATTITSSPAENTGVVPVGISVPLGVPLVIADGVYKEAAVAVKQVGQRIWFNRPLFFGHSGASLYTITRNKVDPSHLEEQPDGSWRGIFTAYDPASGIFAEYTLEVVAPDLLGPWSPSGSGMRFKPWLSATVRSTENPARLRSNPDC